jgi:hypothetical protein
LDIGFWIKYNQEALMDDSKLRELINEKMQDGTLSCQDAHTIAEKLGVHLSLVGMKRTTGSRSRTACWDASRKSVERVQSAECRG